MSTVGKAALLARTLPTDTVPVEGGTVTVRGISRTEARTIQDTRESHREALILSLGMVDPAMTPEEVELWATVAPAGELDAVSKKIGELSKLLDSSGQDAYKSV